MPDDHVTTRAARVRFWGLAAALLVLLMSTNAPSPIYALYQARFGFSPLVLTALFATYPATLLPSLLLVAPLAEVVGHRRLLLGSLALASAAGVVFAAADGVAWLFAARAGQGVAVGSASAAFTATLIALEPAGRTRRASLVASLTATAGVGLGPLVAGIVAAKLPGPTTTAFRAMAVLCALALAVTAGCLPAGVRPAAGRWRPRRPGWGVRGADGTAFVRAAVAVFAAWAVTALFLSLLPGRIGLRGGHHDPLLGGLASGLVLLVAAATQAALSRLAVRTAVLAGLPLLATALVVLVVGDARDSAPAMLLAAVVAGAGLGLTMMGALRVTTGLSPDPRTTDGLLGTFYLAYYGGVGIPIVGVGLLATRVGTSRAIGAFAVVVAAACVAVAVWTLLAPARRVGQQGRHLNTGGVTRAR
ncbi:MFS transporter [Micromonospora sp. NPDC049559]|uniref:MFS transporter n=1 Tax=Micromonospora sp. NPDC049559 TaxID=3155923 RepID=UPI003414D321